MSFVERLPAKYFVFAVTALYALLQALILLNHELSRDEIQSWLIARDSIDLSSLLYNTRYEPHPLAWYMLLAFYQKIFPDVFYMRLIPWISCTVAAFFLLSNSSLPRYFIVGILFSFCGFYLYGTFSRQYCLIYAYVLIVSCWLPNRWRHLGKIAIASALVLQFHFFSAFLVAGLGMAMIVDLVQHVKNNTLTVPTRKIVLYFSLVIFSFIILLIQYRIPTDFFAERPIIDFDQLYGVINNFCLVIFGDIIFHLENKFGNVFVIAAFVLSFTCFVVLIRRDINAIIIFMFPFSAIFYVQLTRYAGHLWHSSFIFMAFILAVVMFRSRAPNNQIRRIDYALATVLALQFFTSLRFATHDMKVQYSNIENVGKMLVREGLAEWPLAVVGEPTPGLIAAVTSAKRVYFADADRFGTFTIYDGSYKLISSRKSEAYNAGIVRAAALGRNVVLVVSSRVPPDLLAQNGFQEYASFFGAHEDFENFIVYLKRSDVDAAIPIL